MHRFHMNTTILKSPSLWVSVAAAVLGVLLSQHVIADGSVLGVIAGWLLTFAGPAVAGHTVATSKILV